MSEDYEYVENDRMFVLHHDSKHLIYILVDPYAIYLAGTGYTKARINCEDKGYFRLIAATLRTIYYRREPDWDSVLRTAKGK